MTKIARVYRIEMLIKAKGHVSFRELLDELEVSPATLKRDLDYLRDQLGAPIEYDRYVNGYRLGKDLRGQKHELPGLWFNERELDSLLMTHQLLSELDGQGTLNRFITLKPGVFKSYDDSKKPMFPNVFSRASGRAFIWVTRVGDHLEPREFRESSDEGDGAQDGYAISPAAREEVLKRVLALNHQRAKEEAAQAPAAKVDFPEIKP